MVSIILTWIGAILGIAVLLAMAFGAFVLDFDDARNNADHKKRRALSNTTTPTTPTP
ncbi:hypothetical protein SAMN05421630_10390 [Prauserella marina]|uniref:Uncharacterized protein n=1 Tax=Prauserella marina TaxID=530584 RepID=A0A1G6NED8_9PSEU|nr:hypothetical protein [Prauserella marina]PWV82314.1 hypothetical protein DES30_102554 [Prauserella marina]SDC66071.1 hypothetical protein SAMN05421630_10390 [Prauserella marina]